MDISRQKTFFPFQRKKRGYFLFIFGIGESLVSKQELSFREDSEDGSGYFSETN